MEHPKKKYLEVFRGSVETNASSTSRKFLSTLEHEHVATLEHVHPIKGKLFTKDIPNKPSAGRLPHFMTPWEKINQGQEILSIVKGYGIPFVSLLFQEKIPDFWKCWRKDLSKK